VRPYADGGETTVENIELRCRAHNAYEAEQYFGPPLVVRDAHLPFGRGGNSVRTEFMPLEPQQPMLTM
jgi:hypothetical protein